MRKFLLLQFFILISCINVFGQNDNEIHLIKGYTYSTTIPFELVQNLIVIDSIIIDNRMGSFIFDTGNQSALVLNSAAFQEEIYQEINKHSFTDTARGITGNIPVTSNIKIDSLTLTTDFTFAGLNAIAFNLEHVRKAIGRNFLGFIGYGVLREVEFIIDYNKKVIHLYRLDNNGETLEQPPYKRTPLLNFTVERGSMMSYIYFAGKQLNFFLDTGAPKNSIDARTAKELDQSFISYTGLKDTVTGGDGNSIITSDAMMLLLTVKDVQFTYMNTNIYNFPGNAGYNATLGYPFFSQKLLAVNYKKRQIYLCE